MKLSHARLPNYVAAWNMKTHQWHINHASHLLKAGTYQRVIGVPSLTNSEGLVEASFRSEENALSDEDAAEAAAQALFRFFDPDEEEVPSVKKIVMTSVATGSRYEFES